MIRSGHGGLHDHVAEESRTMVAFHIVAKQAGNYGELRNQEGHPSRSTDQVVLSERQMAWGTSSCTGHELAET